MTEDDPSYIVAGPGFMVPFAKHLAGLQPRKMTMPSKTPKQARTMAAAAHNPAFAKKVGIPVTVAREFNAADTGRRILTVKRSGKRGA
jgi:hypothetical protein